MNVLHRPIVYVSKGLSPDLTVLTGSNVGLAPAVVGTYLRDAVVPALPGPDGLRILAFVRSRIHGVAGLTGIVRTLDDGTERVEIERMFGGGDARVAFATAFRSYLSAPGRFAREPAVCWSAAAARPEDDVEAAFAGHLDDTDLGQGLSRSSM